MYPVSAEYIAELHSEGIRRRIRGRVDNIDFTEHDILGGTFEYTDKCVKSDDIKLGGVFVGEFTCTFLPAFSRGISRGSWRGRVITFSIGLLVGDTWVDIPCKPYKIDEAMHSKFGVEVKAYDYMHSFDKPFHMDTTAGSLYDLAAYACQACGVTLGMTEAQMEALPNGEETVALWPTNDIETWRDFISWIAVTHCGFATMNRNGELVFKTWHTTPDITLDINDRYTGGKWSDYTTYFTGLSLVNIESEVTEYYSREPDTGLTMKLGSNPLMQYGTNETHMRQVYAILDALANFVYVPYSSSGLIDPCLDLGDVIEYEDGLAGSSSICCVHSMYFQYSKGMKLKGYGKNPAMADARSKTDKNISGLLSRQSESDVVTHTYENSAALNLAENTPTSIIKIRFATINAKVIKLLSEVQLDTTATSQDGIVQAVVRYYLDSDLLPYSPVTTWDNDGEHLLNLIYWLQNLEGGRQYSWEVTLEIKGGTATIDRGWIHSLLEAQGLVATEEWDGLIEINEEYSLNKAGNKTFGYSDSVSFIWQDVEAANITENYSLNKAGRKTFSYTDSIDIDVIKTIYNIVSEDKDYRLVSEDGNYNIESED